MGATECRCVGMCFAVKQHAGQISRIQSRADEAKRREKEEQKKIRNDRKIEPQIFIFLNLDKTHQYQCSALVTTSIPHEAKMNEAKHVCG